MALRLRDVVAMVVVLLVMGVSSQAMVCELVCAAPAIGCHAAARVTVSTESHDGMAMGGDCDHEMRSAAVRVGSDSVASCPPERCGHVTQTVFAKSDSAVDSVQVIQWVTTDAVRVDEMVVSGGRRLPGVLGNACPALTSLRV